MAVGMNPLFDDPAVTVVHQFSLRCHDAF
jgi:hypothetical protein